MVRVFVAIELPEDVREKMSSIQEELKVSRAKMNFVNSAMSHITLKFIGEVDSSGLDRVKEELKNVEFDRFTLRLKGVSLNSTKVPRVVWIDGYDGGEMSSLNDNIENRLSPLGVPVEKRKFKIHATIARIKRFDPSLLPIVEKFSSEDFGEFEVSGFKLKKSTLLPDGPVYEDIMEVSF
ncbi:RNA 2',3'-cyclic phosphodiesterase [Methanoplanus sp. FWC-SCC4]|uniref:RNA 2',3'-cyclic phosphodiesterase n=1 Tax=Methanochimaera problematica TaxID=2609417 RepID=A0AA97FDE0_9EURY|nr:RNA 2',3'-cyclic phosphodiesterase [Methanoplanus sp. FWC-SCC4]WOF16188.1 RNA 2',3'-cyclic phosphodiesterase [Methanoplanus sp. FWC-SCC4]